MSIANANLHGELCCVRIVSGVVYSINSFVNDLFLTFVVILYTLVFILYEGSKAAKTLTFPIDRNYAQVEKSVCPPPVR